MRTNVLLNISQNVKMDTMQVVIRVKMSAQQSLWKIVDKWLYPIADKLLMNNADKHQNKNVPMYQGKNVIRFQDTIANK